MCSGETVTNCTPERTMGYILTRFADTYGRPVPFAYAGASRTPLPPGAAKRRPEGHAAALSGFGWP